MEVPLDTVGTRICWDMDGGTVSKGFELLQRLLLAAPSAGHGLPLALLQGRRWEHLVLGRLGQGVAG